MRLSAVKEKKINVSLISGFDVERSFVIYCFMEFTFWKEQRTKRERERGNKIIVSIII